MSHHSFASNEDLLKLTSIIKNHVIIPISVDKRGNVTHLWMNNSSQIASEMFPTLSSKDAEWELVQFLDKNRVAMNKLLS